MRILTIDDKDHERFLRTPVPKTDPAAGSARELRALAKTMRTAMQAAGGVGLAANQIGVPKRFFIAQIPDSEGHYEFYAVLNPTITKRSRETVVSEEGCLSIPGKYGDVSRAEAITIQGETIDGRPAKHAVRGLAARIFQHEIDHLDGVLFIDKAKNIRTITMVDNDDKEMVSISLH